MNISEIAYQFSVIGGPKSWILLVCLTGVFVSFIAEMLYLSLAVTRLGSLNNVCWENLRKDVIHPPWVIGMASALIFLMTLADILDP